MGKSELRARRSAYRLGLLLDAAEDYFLRQALDADRAYADLGTGAWWGLFAVPPVPPRESETTRALAGLDAARERLAVIARPAPAKAERLHISSERITRFVTFDRLGRYRPLPGRVALRRAIRTADALSARIAAEKAAAQLAVAA
jgi:hypothetical protein